MSKSKIIFATFFLLMLSLSAFGQANLTIQNNSIRSMTVKIMKGSNNKGTLHQIVSIGAHCSATVNFSNTGYYFTKTKAVLVGKIAIYQKGKPFHVVNDDTGYSVLKLTFTIKESTVPQVSGGELISKSEFDLN